MLSIFTAKYNIFIIVTFLIVVHEVGHFLCAKLFGGEIDKIIIYPLGGISKFKLPLNFSIMKEFLIVLAGPLFQFISYFLLLKFWGRYEEIIRLYHYSMLAFNLLPIYPLDGGRLVNLFLMRFFPYKVSMNMIIVISYIFIFFLIVINYNSMYLNLIIIVLFLVYKLVLEKRQIDYIYNKFLLERYINNYSFRKSKIINNGNYFYKNRRHVVKIDDNYYLEKEYLEKKYKNR